MNRCVPLLLLHKDVMALWCLCGTSWFTYKGIFSFSAPMCLHMEKERTKKANDNKLLTVTFCMIVDFNADECPSLSIIFLKAVRRELTTDCLPSSSLLCCQSHSNRTTLSSISQWYNQNLLNLWALAECVTSDWDFTSLSCQYRSVEVPNSLFSFLYMVLQDNNTEVKSCCTVQYVFECMLCN